MSPSRTNARNQGQQAAKELRETPPTATTAHSTGTANLIELDVALARYQVQLSAGLRAAVAAARAGGSPAPASESLLDEFYGQLEYHLGWRDTDLRLAQYHPGKMLRPTLLLLACELAAGRQAATPPAEAVERAVAAAVAVELVHNFSLVHDDIEDADEQRRHRPTLWKLWGIPLAINAGDGIFALARQGLWQLTERGVAAESVVRLAALLDRTCVLLCEGQFLDMRFEGQRTVTVAMYLEMIERKTAALMACAAQMGGILGAPDEPAVAARLGEFGQALGMAFQIRDDLLGIWAATDLGKSAAGDLRRKKMSLPVIDALEHATPADQRTMTDIYTAHGPASEEQIATLLAILQQTEARAHCLATLRAQCAAARAALDAASEGSTAHEAHAGLHALLDFVAAESI